MGWFKRIKEGITTSTKEKKETLKECGIIAQSAKPL